MADERRTRTTIADVLQGELGERFFGDGTPRWREGRNRARPQTAAEAADERRLLVNALRRDGGGSALGLARRLQRCREDRRCLSGACPACRRALQRMVVHATRNLFEHHERDMVAANIVSAKRAIRYGRLELHALFDGIERRLRGALEAVGAPAIGGFDVSANEHEADAFAPHWMPHAWILADGRRMRRVKAALRRWFRATDIVPRPVRARQFDGARAGFAYALKRNFDRRVSLEPRWRSDGSRSTFSTHKGPIWDPQRVELALALDRAGLDARLFLHGYELVESRGDVEIVRLAPTRRPTKKARQSDRE
jgi:hypothetical protein